MRTATVKLYDLTDALEMDSETISSWLDRNTGKVVMVESEVMDAVEAEEEDDLLDWQREELVAARAISAGDPRYLALPTKFDFHEYRYMEKFIGTIADAAKADQLWQAIKGKGAFRYFKDTAHRLDVIDDWYRYRDEAMNEFMLRWAEVNEITVDQAPRGPAQS
ncbi:MAG TPA: UPF0158 family protein [Lacunisphaera sp.]